MGTAEGPPPPGQTAPPLEWAWCSATRPPPFLPVWSWISVHPFEGCSRPAHCERVSASPTEEPMNANIHVVPSGAEWAVKREGVEEPLVSAPHPGGGGRRPAAPRPALTRSSSSSTAPTAASAKVSYGNDLARRPGLTQSGRHPRTRAPFASRMNTAARVPWCPSTGGVLHSHVPKPLSHGPGVHARPRGRERPTFGGVRGGSASAIATGSRSGRTPG